VQPLQCPIAMMVALPLALILLGIRPSLLSQHRLHIGLILLKPNRDLLQQLIGAQKARVDEIDCFPLNRAEPRSHRKALNRRRRPFRRKRRELRGVLAGVRGILLAFFRSRFRRRSRQDRRRYSQQ